METTWSGLKNLIFVKFVVCFCYVDITACHAVEIPVCHPWSLFHKKSKSLFLRPRKRCIRSFDKLSNHFWPLKQNKNKVKVR